MNEKEILAKLTDLGIILFLGGEWVITEKYKDLLAMSETKAEPFIPPKKLDYDKLLDPNTAGDSWPVDVKEQRGRTRFTAFMTVCGIPNVCAKGNYRLRSADKEAINILDNIVDDPTVHGGTFIDAIKLYYKYTEMPKSFSNLVKGGDCLDLYQEHIAGSLKKDLLKGSGDSDFTGDGNSPWQNG